jgi:hypothetical protein
MYSHFQFNVYLHLHKCEASIPSTYTQMLRYATLRTGEYVILSSSIAVALDPFNIPYWPTPILFSFLLQLPLIPGRRSPCSSAFLRKSFITSRKHFRKVVNKVYLWPLIV